jgi:hypothetical protein
MAVMLRFTGNKASIYIQGELASVLVFVQNETVESYTPPKLPSRITDSKIRELLANTHRCRSTASAADL